LDNVFDPEIDADVLEGEDFDQEGDKLIAFTFGGGVQHLL
jgi:hypothetical protein